MSSLPPWQPDAASTMPQRFAVLPPAAVFFACIAGLLTTTILCAAEPHSLVRFQRQQLTSAYYAEGVGHGDLNRDGHIDVVYGPYWFAGPNLETKHEIYKPVVQPMDGYADQFFCWVEDFNNDGWPDVLSVGFPGTAAFVYENPGSGQPRTWAKHEVFEWVSNESPQWTQLVDDPRPELVCTRDGFLGYLSPDRKAPWGPWKFHRISPQVADKRFGHGLGVGDINGDDRADILVQNGWYEQPPQLGGVWTFHPVEFAAVGGADMFAYDVDGDGDKDVITSLDAHGYGLAWYEQTQHQDQIEFTAHQIMGSTAGENPYGVVFTELHSLALADIDGDGLKDICTGKTYYSHHQQAPMWDRGAVVYWFQLQRTAEGVVWIPHIADGDAGIGRQLGVADINQDGIPDMLCGGMKGCHVLFQERKTVDRETWEAAQPQRRRPMQAGLSPTAAAQQMTVPPGFFVDLAAGEPLVHQPIAFTTDARGRLWVAEAYTYPQRAADGQGRDKIVILEDTNLDGQLDHRKEFATGLNLISGLEVGFGGVWVGAAPYLMFIPDRDHDDRPDGAPQILLDGFGYQDTHETLNSFLWGPDGWLYGCHGVFTHSLVGKPGTPDANRVPLNAGVWRYHPTRHQFDVFARGTSNPWGVDFDDHGQAFLTACVIPHLWHVIQGGRYQRQGGQHFNPYLYDDLKTIADHSHYTGNIRDSAWWGHEPELSDSISIAGGGHAHCGAMIYLADNWPKNYRDSIYFNNIHGNRVNCDLLTRHGSGFVGKHGPDFLLANDKWYRGINLKYGPDGSVHLIDWYDKNACHRQTPEIWDRSNGRIYRVRYGDVKPLRVNLANASSVELAKLQAHDNDWFVRTARRLLQERVADDDSIQEARAWLMSMLMDATTQPAQRLRALWALHVTGGVPSATLLGLSEDQNEYLRAWSLQLAIPEVSLPHGTPTKATSEWLTRLEQLAEHDPAPLVRLYVASATQRIAPQQRWGILAKLLAHQEDARDPNLPLMIWYATEPLVARDARSALELAAQSQIPVVARYIIRRAASDEQAIHAVMASLPQASSPRMHMIADEILQAFSGRVDIPMPASWRPAYEAIQSSDDAALIAKGDQIAAALGDERILPRMRSVLGDPQKPIAQRSQALEVLVRGRDALASNAFLAALDEPLLRSAAIRALARYEDPQIAEALVQRYASLSPAVRRDALSTLTARIPSALRLLDAVEAGTIPRSDIHAYDIRQLQSLEAPELTARIETVWGAIRESTADKRATMRRYRDQLAEDAVEHADLSLGRVVYQETCGACHRLFGVGGAIGPDLTGSNRANRDYLLENVVDPSAIVSKDYRMSTLVLYDGRTITGLIEKETASAWTVRTVNEVVVVAKKDVEEQSLSKLSLMPEGQLVTLGRDQVRDLVAYLASPQQVPNPRKIARWDEVGGRAVGAIEAETLEVLKTSHGTTSVQDMAGFPAERWSAGHQLWWTGQSIGAQLDLAWDIPKAGNFLVEVALTRARDYGIVQFFLDGKPLGDRIDCYVADRVDTTGILSLGTLPLRQGRHRLSVRVVDRHPESVGTMVGIDFLRLTDQLEAPARHVWRRFASASYCFAKDSPTAILDGTTPSSSGDQSIPRLTWWDHYGTREWAHVRYSQPQTFTGTAVYWFDDRDIQGGCRVPQSWRLLYRDGLLWKEVPTKEPRGVALDRFNRVTFAPVTSTEFRIEVQLQSGVSAGILEWQLLPFSPPESTTSH